MLKQLQEGMNFEVEIPITTSGKMDALAVWFDLHLIEDITITTSPSGPTCWEQAIFPVIPPTASKTGAGKVYLLTYLHIMSEFDLRPIPKKAVYKGPLM